MTGENRFVFVAPMYNASETLERMLHSLYGQSYGNWRLFLIDDVSDRGETRRCEEILYTFNVLNSLRVRVIWNDEKKWEVANVLHGISLCEPDDIICRIDADDWLTDLDALAIIDHAYRQYELDCLWTAHRWGLSDKNISGPMPNGADPYKHPWVSSHLKTFRKRLLDGVPYENFLNMNGDLVRRAGDQCLYLPVLRNAKSRAYLPRVMYHYHIDERGGAVYQTDDARFQKAEADFIRARGYIESGMPWEKTTKAYRS